MTTTRGMGSSGASAGTWSQPGVHPPEILGREAAVTTTILDGLADRGVRVTRDERSLEG